MNNKILGLFLLTAVLLSVLVSAALSVSSPEALTRARNSTTFTIANPSTSASVNVTLSAPLNITDSKGKIIQLSATPQTFTLTNGTSQTITVSYSSIPSGFIRGSYSAPITAFTVDNSSINISASLQFIDSFCSRGNVPLNDPILEITRLSDEKIDNKNAWDWHPIDNIEVSVKVRNSGEKDLDIVLEYGLFKAGSNTEELDADSIDLSIDSGDTSDEQILQFKIPADIDEGTYRFYVKAYDDGNEKSICTDKKDDAYFQEVDISKESRAIILDDVEIQSPAQCGDTVQLSADAVNSGKDTEDRVLVSVFNRELGIDKFQVLKDLDEGESESIDFNIAIPQNATDKVYTLELKTRFKYDDDNSGCNTDDDSACYDKDSGDIDKTFTIPLKVEGCKPVAPVIKDNVQITATLESETAKAGEDFIIKATIKNTGSSAASYLILASGTESFATVQTIAPQSLTLNAGQSQDVLLTLRANADAAGDYTFSIKSVSGANVKEQPVQVAIQPKTGVFTGFASLNIFSNLQNNWFIWIVVLINIVLIVLIVVVAVRIARK